MKDDRKELPPLPVFPGVGSRWLHLRTDGVYEVMMVGRCSETLAPVVVYTDTDGGAVWVRPHAVFTDGRFAPVVC